MESSDIADIKRQVVPCRIGSSNVARRAINAAGLLLLLLSAAVPASDSDNPGSEFSAMFKFSGKLGNRQIGGTIVANRYTPVEEARQLAEILKTQGQAGLASALRGRSNGVLRLGALDYSLDLVTAKPTSKGFKLLVVTNRPIRYEETDQGSPSLDYPFGIVVIEIDSLGRGEGRFFPSAALRIQEDGAIDVYPYSEGEGRVTDVKKVR